MGLLQDASLIVTPNAYKAGKLYSVVPSDGTGDFTVTRATSATRVNSLGLIETVGINVPRIDYTNASCPSILVEPQRTNLLLQSEQFQSISFGGSWNFGSIQQTLLNIATSPSGLLDADKIFPTATLGSHFIFQLITTNKTVTQTASCFFKASEYTRCGIRFNDNSTNQGNIFDLISGQVIASIGTKTTAKITNYGNGWYRCEITITAPTDLLNIQFSIIDNNSIVFDFTGDNTKGLFFWGAQLELGGNATSYIPTTTAAVTRNADVITKSDISNLIGQTEGTIFVDYNKVLANDSPRNIISITDGTSSNVIEIWDGIGAGNLGMLLYSCTTNSILKSSGVGQTIVSPSGKYKICLTYLFTSTNMNFNFFINGVKVRTDNYTFTEFSNPLSKVNIGNRNGLFIGSGGHNVDFISKTKITDAQAIQLTTL